MNKILSILLLSLLPAFADNTTNCYSGQAIGPGTNITNIASTGGGGGNVYALVAHSTGTAAGTATATTTSADITTAKLVVVSIGNANSSGSDSGPTDSQGNTFIEITPARGGSGGLGTNDLWYCINPSTSASYTVSCKRNQTTVCIAAFSCTGTPVFDASTGNGNGSFSTIQPGSQTPSGTELFVCGEGSFLNAAGTLSINSSFTITDQIDRFNSALFCGLAYKNSSSAENPTWTSSASGQAGGTIMATFK